MKEKKEESQVLVTQQAQQSAMVRAEPLSIQQVFAAVLEKNISADQLQVAKQLLAMDAERQFNIAFSALQSELPTIVAKTIIPNRGKYERFEDVMEAVRPALNNNGFSVSFSNEWKDNRITESCHLSHIGGHSRTNSFTVRVGKADTETQADCKAATTAKRNALLNALNIVIRQDALQNEDDDPRLEGSPITKEQADELERRVKETNSDEKTFLKLAGSANYRDILSGKYSVLDEMLRLKEQRGR
jgi:ERF superfamily